MAQGDIETIAIDRQPKRSPEALAECPIVQELVGLVQVPVAGVGDENNKSDTLLLCANE